MGLTIGSGLGALNAARGINESQRTLSDSMKRIATGVKTNSAADNPAGMVAAESMRLKLSSISSAATSNEKSSNVLLAAEGSLGMIGDMLSKVRENVVLAAGSANDAETRNASANEIESLTQAIDGLAQSATFGGKKLFDGSFTVTADSSSDGQTNSLKIDKVSSETLGAGATTGDGEGNEQPTGQVRSLADLKEYVKNGGDLNEALAVVDKAVSQVSEAREKIGSMADSVQQVGQSFGASYQELSSARSQIQDTDFAAELAKVTSENMKAQVKVSLMAQGKDTSTTFMNLLR